MVGASPTPSNRYAATRSALPLSSSGSTVSTSTCLAHELVRELADEHLVGGRGLFEPRCSVHGVAGNETLTGRDIARDDLAGIDAGPVRELDAVPPELLVELAQRLLHAIRSANRPERVVLVQPGSPKTAMIASPMYFSIVPPWRSSAAFIESK